MGKCKRRAISKAKNHGFKMQFTRYEALKAVIEEITKNPASVYARELILLFGLSAEELSESGVSYEVLRSLDAVLL